VKAHFLSTVPSPLKRDVFAALDRLSGVELGVFYNETDLGEHELQPYEKVLPGFSLGMSTSRFHFNHSEEEFLDAEVVVLTSYLNNLSQKVLYTFASQRPKVVYWGGRLHRELLGVKDAAKAILSWPLRNCDAIAGAGKIAEQSFREAFPDKLVYNVPYLCEVDALVSIPRSRVEPPWTIVYRGPMTPRLGVDLLLGAFQSILRQGIDADLSLVGEKEDLDQLVAGLDEKVRKRIHHKPEDKAGEPADWLTDADLLVVPSRSDLWGFTVNQAVASGIPVIASDTVDSAQDLIKVKENGDIFPSEDSEALVGALVYFLSDPKRMRDAGLQSRILSKRYTPEWGAQRFEGMFSELLAAK